MANSKDLQIVVNAVDNASKELKNIQTGLNDLGNSSVTAGQKQESMTGSIFSGLLTYQLFTKALGEVVDFLKQSVELFQENELAAIALKGAIEGTGVNFQTINPELEKYTQNAMQLGFTDHQVAQALTILTAYTGDYKKALEEGNIVQEMAIYNLMTGRSTTLDLNMATEQLARVHVGGTRALKDYGINIKDVSTEGEVLAEIHKTLKPIVEDFTNSAAAHGLVLQAQWEKLQETMGKNFSQAVNNARDTLMALVQDNSINAFVKNGSEAIGQFASLAVMEISVAVVTITDTLKLLGKSMISVGSTIGSVFSDIIHGNFAKIKTDAEQGWSDLIDISVKSGSDWESTVRKLNTAATQTSTQMKTSFGDMGNLTKDFTDKVGTTANAAATKFDELKNKIKDFANSSNNDLLSVSQTIADTLDKINNLDVDKSKGDLDTRQQYADAYVKQEQDILKLKQDVNQKNLALSQSIMSAGGIENAQKDPNYWASKDALDQAKNNLQTAQADLDKYKTVSIAYSKEIDSAEKEAAKSDFERTLDQLQQKKTAADQDYQLKKNQLTAELSAEVGKWATIKIIQDQAKLQTQKFLLESNKQTIDSINREIAYYNTLAQAIANSKAGKTSSQISAASINNQLNQVAAQQKGQVNVNISGNTINGTGGLKELADTIGKQITNTLGLNTQLTY